MEEMYRAKHEGQEGISGPFPAHSSKHLHQPRGKLSNPCPFGFLWKPHYTGMID